MPCSARYPSIERARVAGTFASASASRVHCLAERRLGSSRDRPDPPCAPGGVRVTRAGARVSVRRPATHDHVLVREGARAEGTRGCIQRLGHHRQRRPVCVATDVGSPRRRHLLGRTAHVADLSEPGLIQCRPRAAGILLTCLTGGPPSPRPYCVCRVASRVNGSRSAASSARSRCATHDRSALRTDRIRFQVSAARASIGPD